MAPRSRAGFASRAPANGASQLGSSGAVWTAVRRGPRVGYPQQRSHDPAARQLPAYRSLGELLGPNGCDLSNTGGHMPILPIIAGQHTRK